jgi:hypothetical protein
MAGRLTDVGKRTFQYTGCDAGGEITDRLCVGKGATTTLFVYDR